jgi:hypothetical protein
MGTPSEAMYLAVLPKFGILLPRALSRKITMRKKRPRMFSIAFVVDAPVS